MNFFIFFDLNLTHTFQSLQLPQPYQLSSPVQFSAFSSKTSTYINIATDVRTIYTYAFHITASEAILSPILIIYFYFFRLLPVHLSFSLNITLSCSPFLSRSFFLSISNLHTLLSFLVSLYVFFFVCLFNKIFKWEHPDCILYIFIETKKVINWVCLANLDSFLGMRFCFYIPLLCSAFSFH